MTKNRVIGKEGDLPWHIPEDFASFKRLTKEKAVVMGRKTWDSIPPKFRPLPNRTNIVVSRSLQEVPGAITCNSIQTAITEGKKHSNEVCIIGGGAIYAQALPLTDVMYLSIIDENYEGDTFFPEFNENEWNIESQTQFDQFTLKKYVRKQK